MRDDLRTIYAKHLSSSAEAASAWTSFASQFLEQDGTEAGGVAVVVVDERALTAQTTKLSNLRLRLGDLLSCSARTGATLLGLGLSSLGASTVVPLAVMQVLLFIRDVKKLQSIELTESDVKLLLWLEEQPHTWVDQDDCFAQFGDARAALRRLEALGCLSCEGTKWRVVEHVRFTPQPDEGHG